MVNDERSPQCTTQLLNEEIQQLESELQILAAETLSIGSTGHANDSSNGCKMQAIFVCLLLYGPSTSRSYRANTR
jgi:hypothetical protein